MSLEICRDVRSVLTEVRGSSYQKSTVSTLVIPEVVMNNFQTADDDKIVAVALKSIFQENCGVSVTKSNNHIIINGFGRRCEPISGLENLPDVDNFNKGVDTIMFSLDDDVVDYYLMIHADEPAEIVAVDENGVSLGSSWKTKVMWLLAFIIMLAVLVIASWMYWTRVIEMDKPGEHSDVKFFKDLLEK